MRLSERVVWAGAVCLGLYIGSSAPAAANELTAGFGDGHWRAEMMAVTGTYSGKNSRAGDFILTGSAEYEWPIYARASLGLKAYPLFMYFEREDEDYGSGAIYGVGAGISGRIYQSPEVRNGFFVELGGSALLHSSRFEGNSSKFNFLTEIGAGYKWKNDWHVALKWIHISNAGIGSHNSGVNGFGLAVGYSF
jgi:hypothetical protein